MSLPSRRQPRGGRGIYLNRHAHIWQEWGTAKHPNGETSVCWRCAVCTDVIYADVEVRSTDTDTTSNKSDGKT